MNQLIDTADNLCLISNGFHFTMLKSYLLRPSRSQSYAIPTISISYSSKKIHRNVLTHLSSGLQHNVPHRFVFPSDRISASDWFRCMPKLPSLNIFLSFGIVFFVPTKKEEEPHPWKRSFFLIAQPMGAVYRLLTGSCPKRYACSKPVIPLILLL